MSVQHIMHSLLTTIHILTSTSNGYFSSQFFFANPIDTLSIPLRKQPPPPPFTPTSLSLFSRIGKLKSWILATLHALLNFIVTVTSKFQKAVQREP